MPEPRDGSHLNHALLWTLGGSGVGHSGSAQGTRVWSRITHTIGHVMTTRLAACHTGDAQTTRPSCLPLSQVTQPRCGLPVGRPGRSLVEGLTPVLLTAELGHSGKLRSYLLLLSQLQFSCVLSLPIWILTRPRFCMSQGPAPSRWPAESPGQCVVWPAESPGWHVAWPAESPG